MAPALPLPLPRRFRLPPVGLILIVLVWCGIVGSAIAVQLEVALAVDDAARRYRSVAGQVHESAIRSHGQNSSSDAPVLEVGYAVDGRGYRCRQVLISDVPLYGGPQWAHTYVADHQPGSAVTVWYDPLRPERAVLERGYPPSYWNLWLFLQPFLAAGCALLLLLAATVLAPLAERRCLEGTFAPGWTIPALGVVQAVPQGLTVGGQLAWMRVLAVILLGYGLASFGALGLFMAAAGSSDTPWGSRPEELAPALLVALAAGIVLATLVRRWLHAPRLDLDQLAKRLAFTSATVQFDEPWSALVGWRVGGASGGSPTVSILELVTGTGVLPLLRFRDDAVARHVAAQVAEATGRPLDPPAPGSNPSADVRHAD
jgi:hypothetical protein